MSGTYPSVFFLPEHKELSDFWKYCVQIRRWEHPLGWVHPQSMNTAVRRGIYVTTDEGQKDFTNQMFLRTAAEQHSPSSTGALKIITHSSNSCTHKNYTGTSLPKLQHEWRRSPRGSAHSFGAISSWCLLEEAESVFFRDAAQTVCPCSSGWPYTHTHAIRTKSIWGAQNKKECLELKRESGGGLQKSWRGERGDTIGQGLDLIKKALYSHLKQ